MSTSSPWTDRRRRFQDWPNYRWAVLGLTMAGIASTSFPITVLSASLPEIATDLTTSESAVSWVQTAPLIAMAVGTPVAGKVGDLYGHRRLYLWGYALATCFAVLTGLAWNVGSLVAMRTLGQFIGAATLPASMAIIMTVFARRERALALGYWSAVTALSPAIGVALGGFMVDAFGWRTIFFIQAVPSMIALLAAIPLLPETARKPEVRFDIGGAVSLGLAVAGLLMAINRGPEWGWGHPLVLAGLAVGPTAIAAFCTIERLTADPLFPLDFLGRRGFVVPNLVTFLGHMAYMGTLVVAPFMLEGAFGITDVSRISAALIARPVGFSVGAWYAGRVESRLGGRTIMISGGLIMSAALAGTGAAILAGWLAAVIVLLFVAGVGQGTIRPAAVAGVANSVDDADLGVASGAHQMIGHIGAATGITIMITVLGSSDSAERFFAIFVLAAAIASVSAFSARWSPGLGIARSAGAGRRSRS
ncbi:MFS transporter [Candidatus Poriferisocius sp.]|uniref:MFS transporter n=1 Tax=Candidatus Poriferisocius sp. TaxID=3101276 RepID=UPI003B52FCEC